MADRPVLTDDVIEITPQMIEAGVSLAGRVLDNMGHPLPNLMLEDLVERLVPEVLLAGGYAHVLEKTPDVPEDMA